ncbi:hypothetical protein DL767_003419 [Monosporascus sp. MG133]|nr:hypothetical protein DL767_003419 [Monosporascus sp. MG133]
MSEAGQQQRLRLLCFDGGGVRGLSSLYIIQQLMEAVDRQHPPKPCQFFDMIGGTSTGGLIAIMLGRLEMSVADCIAAYSKMMDGVFKKKQHRVDIRGQVQARFDTAQLERCIKSIVRQYGLGANENLLMRDGNLNCKVFACATPMLVATDIVKFSSYQREYEPISDLFDEVKIWEVCRATAAASTFFDPIKVGKHKLEFLDGATRANNPINELWKEAEEAFGEDFSRRIQCLVSIGTGQSGKRMVGKTAVQVVGTLKHLATETQVVYDEFKYSHRELSENEKLYRFNVMSGLEDVGLEDASSQDVVAQMTMSYMGTQDMKETLKKFKRVTEHQDQNSTGERASRHIQSPPSRRPMSQGFLTLGRESKHVNLQPQKKSYWSRLTIDALLVYEGVYKAMCDPSTDNRFHDYFANLNPVPQGLKGDLVKRVWLRLPLEEQASANKDLILAAIYMIHMEGLVNPTYRPNFSPPDSNQFSYYRAKFMWRYGNWVRCSCGCGRIWSFANGVEGLRYDRWKSADRKCQAEVPGTPPRGSSKLMKVFNMMAEKKQKNALRFFEKNRLSWNELQKEEDRIQLGSMH